MQKNYRLTPLDRVPLLSVLSLLLLSLLQGPGLAQSGENQENGDETGDAAIVRLSGLTDSESEDLYQSVLQRAYFDLGYESASEEEPVGSDRLSRYEHLERSPAENEKRSLMIGLKIYATRSNELILRGRKTVDGTVQQANPDILNLQNVVNNAQKRLKEQDKTYSVSELDVEFYQLTNIMPEQCLQILSSLGYRTESPAKDATFSLQDLPIVYPAPDSKQPTVVSDGQSTLESPTQSAPQNRLIFLHHRSQADEIIKLKQQLREQIDVPSRQVLIESMLVEVTKEGRRELGVQWEGANEEFDIESSFQTSGGETPLTISHEVFNSPVSMNQFKADLRALVRDNEAEVLSSPSVLTLNNTQASIEVIEEVPVFNTIFGSNVPNVAEFNVSFEEVGITLNIKPRISKSSETVTMQIQGEVSEAPRDEFVEVDGEPVAPVINRRQVNTIARVNDNTPFIIGGLIRRTDRTNMDRVPVLSEIPLIHPLFKIKTDVTERRENIIVLNPRVIQPEGSKRPIKPKDSERFDFLNNELFRNSYRLKSEDVFDLGFIEQNEEVQRLMREAKTFVQKHPDYGDKPPFDTIRKNQIPGEESVAIRMLYEIAQKLELQKQIKLGNLIFFSRNTSTPSGFEVQFLEQKLRDAGIINRRGAFVDRSYPRNVLLFQYDLQPGTDIEQISNTPVASVEVKKVSSREEVNELLLEGNKLEQYERPRTSFVVDSRDDLQRLKTAIMVREMISVNDVLLRLDEFRVGRKIMIPEIQEQAQRIMLIDQDVSSYFYQSEFYYNALKNKLRAYNRGINEVLNEH